jgi:P-type Ca2+ transporter type 2C
MEQQWHSLSIEESLSKLKADKEGLNQSEVEKRRLQYGFNEIPEAGQQSIIMLLFKQFKSLLVAVLFTAAIISLFTGHAIDAYVIFAVILINATIGFTQQLRANKAVASLKSILVSKTKVLRGNEMIILPARELVPGDIIILEEGDSIPADARLIECKNVRTIEGPLTGESLPVGKNEEILAQETPMADRINMLYKSTFIAGGYAKAVVTGTGLKTAIGEIAHSLSGIKQGKTNFQKRTDILGKQMAVIAILSALALFSAAYFLQDSSIGESIIISIAALVAAIPEGLPAVLSIVLAIGANRMAKRKAIMREFTATETIGAITTIITDKTGTLTQNTLNVQKIGIAGKVDIEVSGEGWIPEGKFFQLEKEFDGLNNPAFLQFIKICEWSNNSQINKNGDKFELIGDPTEGALKVLAKKGGFQNHSWNCERVDDLPFSSDLKMRASLINSQGKKQILIIGAPEMVLQKSSRQLTSTEIKELDAEDKTQIKTKIEAWSGEAMRVIALAYLDVDSDTNKIDPDQLNNLTFAGIVGMIDPPRPDVFDSIKKCKEAGIRVIMATGDHVNTAIAIAKETGILEQNMDAKTAALTEVDLLEMNEKEFEKAILSVNVFARLSPNMKLRIAETLQKSGELIAMTGDGVNDAPALKKADIGVAMGIMGTDVARDSAQMVLADDNFSSIVHAIEEGRIVFTNTRQTSFFLVTTNFAEITTLLATSMMGFPIPLTATQILWLNLVTDGVGDIALATEKGHGDVLQQKPINHKEKILNRSIVPFLIINVTLMAILTISVFTWHYDEGLEIARTAAFITMSFCQLFNVLNMRSLKLSVFNIGIFSNRYINMALIASSVITVSIIEIPFFQSLFQFKTISALEFITLVFLSSFVLWFGEIYKWVKRKREKGGKIQIKNY